MDVSLSPLIMALGAAMLSWAAIGVGALGIFIRKEYSRYSLDIMLGIAGGMMLGATFWSLLTPALDMSQHLGKLSFAPALLGLTIGALFLRGFDIILPHLHSGNNITEGMATSWSRRILLVLAMALHHFPEGLAMGVGYGATGISDSSVGTASALILTCSLMLQCIPEGFVVATALRAEGLSRTRSCLFGVLTGCTTPLGAVVGVMAVHIATIILPVTLAFAAGAMLYVIIEDVLPEAQSSGHNNASTLAVIGGVMLVMVLGSLFG